MDFMKAFDKVPHKRLIKKLESYGLSNQIIKWVDNFLNERNQKVTVNGNESTYYLHDQDGKSVELSRSEGEKDVWVMVDDKVNFDKHIQQQVNKANSIMGLIRRTYTSLDETSFRYLFQALVRPHLEYAEAVWSPFIKKDINTIEKVQKRATKLIPYVRNMDYTNRLKN